MPKDSSNKVVYTSFDALRDELKAAYYDNYSLYSQSAKVVNKSSEGPKPTPRNRVLPSKKTRHATA